MYRPKPVQPVRLQKLEVMPTYNDLVSLGTQAEHQNGNKVELPWTMEDGREFMLVASIAAEGGTEWSLIQGTAPRSPLIWTFNTGDIPFLLNLVSSECTGVTLEETISREMLNNNNSKLGLSAQILGMGPGAEDELDYRPSEATLEGDLSQLPSPSVLQSVVLSRLTGQLQVNNENEEIRIWFDDGTPIHAISLETHGDRAITDLLTWTMGRFKFLPSERTTERSVSKRLEVLLMEGVTLLDQKAFLNRTGVTSSSYLIKRNPSLSESEYELAASKGAPISPEVQKQFYIGVSGETTLFEMLRDKPLPKAIWVPILFNLISCDLVVISDRPAQTARKNFFYSMPVDTASIEGARRSLIRPETGLFLYPILLFFMQREFDRFERGQEPFSLILLDLMMRTSTGLEGLTNDNLLLVSEQAKIVTRKMDIFGHFETLSYGILLPQTEPDAATMVAQRFVEAMKGVQLVGNPTAKLALALGVGSVPSDAKELGVLMAGAKEAKERAKRSPSPIMLMRNMLT